MSNTEETTPLLSAYDNYSRPESNEHAMMCPECGESTGLHIDGVSLENASGDQLRVDVGSEFQGSQFNIQQGTGANHDGRRHQISLLGWCEHCGHEFSLTFKQHKGMTFYSKALTGSRDMSDDAI